MDDRQKGLSYVGLGRKYHMDPRTAILYWLNTEIPWKDLPERFEPW